MKTIPQSAFTSAKALRHSATKPNGLKNWTAPIPEEPLWKKHSSTQDIMYEEFQKDLQKTAGAASRK